MASRSDLSSRVSEGLSLASSAPACASPGNASRTLPAGPSSPGTGPESSAGTTCENSPPPLHRQLTFSAAEIPALPAAGRAATGQRSTPTSPDGSLPWPADSAHGGWSARMFLHQTLRTSRPGWTPSDTESWLSSWTLGTSQLRVAGGSSLSDALLPTAPDSLELYLTPQMVRGLLRRAVGRRRPLQRVLLRIPSGWRRRTVTCLSRGEGFAVSIPPSASYSKDSPEAGLLAYLEAAVGPCSVTPSTPDAPSGSDGGLFDGSAT